MKRLFWGVMIVAGLLGPVATAGAQARALGGETLLTSLPAGFKVGSSNRNAQMSLSEYIPQGETLENWSEMVTVVIAYGAGSVEPERMAQSIADGWKKACPDSRSETGGIAEKNGYKAIEWVLHCPLVPQTGKPESLMMVVIQGKDSLYNVQYAFRSEMDDQARAKAKAYLDKVAVCDTRRGDVCLP